MRPLQKKTGRRGVNDLFSRVFSGRHFQICFFEKKPIRDPYLIIKDGQLAGMGAHSYSKGSATGGSEEAAKYKK